MPLISRIYFRKKIFKISFFRFIEMIAEEDMLAIFRPGPYICGEWEFGGLPAWLLHDHPMFFRSSYAPYQVIFLRKLYSTITRQKKTGGRINAL